MTDTTKRYRLRKDIDSPELKAKAGDIGKLGAANKVWFDNGRYFFCKDTVESTSRKEWFELVLPVSEPVKEKVAVSIGACAKNNDKSFNTVFQTNIPITSELSPKVQQAIESALNDTVVDKKLSLIPFEELGYSQDEKLDMAAEFIGKYRHDHTMTNHRIAHSLLYPTSTMNAYQKSEPSALPTKEWQDWKIVDIMDDNGQIISNPSTDVIWACIEHNGERIHSVRRESDQEIFAIGDKISWGETGIYEVTLTEFIIRQGRLKFYYNRLSGEGSPCDFLDAVRLHKIPTPTQPVVEDKPILFTTEDGVEIKEGNLFWYTNIHVWEVLSIAANNWSVNYVIVVNKYKTFSTKEAAEQYILENKPCLSLNDLLEVGKTTPSINVMEHDENYYKNSNLYKAFEQIAKQKLNK